MGFGNKKAPILATDAFFGSGDLSGDRLLIKHILSASFLVPSLLLQSHWERQNEHHSDRSPVVTYKAQNIEHYQSNYLKLHQQTFRESRIFCVTVPSFS